ncbi:MAG TPA: YlzJ-like family protein [Symbiobacteriaceae bacterium]
MTDSGPSVLWTIIPAEMVVQGLPGLDQPVCQEMEVAGRLVEVLPAGDGSATIQRLLSTNPWDYLDARWQPGTKVPLQPANRP